MSSELPLLPLLTQEIRERGPLPFARFMEACLCHPQFGYYNTDRPKLGKSGDFYTSAHVAPVFARILARHWEAFWQRLGRPARFDLVELGPGDGSLAAELLSWLRGRYPEFFAAFRYTGVEQSAHLRGRVEEKLREFAGRARLASEFPGGENKEAAGICGCVFANEFFDALPVHILVWRKGRWRERMVGLKRERLVWVEKAPSLPDLAQQADLYFDSSLAMHDLSDDLPDGPPDGPPDGWTAEIRPQAAEWMHRIGGSIAQGEALIVDYGYTLNEWRGGRFPEGSALAYRGHQVAEDLLGRPGDQDLTAHVNFTELAEAGKASGLRLVSLESQARFLLGVGEPDEFADVFADCASDAERQRRAQLLKTLIVPQAMGEVFRVLWMEK
jgi:SAM-dependent MidA family methyltransferase